MRPGVSYAGLALIALCTGASLTAGVAGCAMEGGPGSLDCNAIERLNHKCGLYIGNVDPDTCLNVFTFLTTTCQGAIRSYVSCAGDQNCRELTDGTACRQEGQWMDIACSGGNATITTGANGNLVTVPRRDLNTPVNDAPWRTE